MELAYMVSQTPSPQRMVVKF